MNRFFAVALITAISNAVETKQAQNTRFKRAQAGQKAYGVHEDYVCDA